MMRSLVVLFLTPVLFLASAEGAQKKIKEYWKDVDLKFSLFQDKVKNASCYANGEELFACVQGINAVLGSLKKPLAFVSPTRAHAAGTTVVRPYGPGFIIELAERDPDDYMNEFRRVRQESEAERSFWRNHFTAPNPRVPIDDLTKWMKDTQVTANDESEFTSHGINGYLSALKDPHTYLTPHAYLAEQQSSSGESFFGIGALMHKLKKTVVVDQPLEGSPAIKAGIRANDIIVEVDGTPLQDMALEDVVAKIRGPEGTEVRLLIKRKGELIPFTITRGKIENKKVDSHVNREAPHVGYLKLADFMYQHGCWELHEAIDQVTRQGAKALILDLRGNGGGRLDLAGCVANLFLDNHKLVVSVVDKDKAVHSPRDLADGENVYTKFEKGTDLPMVTLIDARSASASEIVAGALQDYARSFLVGVRTFGKGSVQHGHPWAEAPGVDLFETTDRFYLPSGRSNQGKALTQDFLAYNKPNPSEEDRFAVREDDLFLNPLPAGGVEFVPPQPQLVREVQACVNVNGTATQRFEAHQNDARRPDYQEFYADDVLNCVVNQSRSEARL